PPLSPRRTTWAITGRNSKAMTPGRISLPAGNHSRTPRACSRRFDYRTRVLSHLLQNGSVFNQNATAFIGKFEVGKSISVTHQSVAIFAISRQVGKIDEG